ncbi:MAG: hypothetical protein ACKVI4_17125 [Actinomycetales bacterium]
MTARSDLHPCRAQELTQRTGKNPNYQYVQMGCSANAVHAMLQFARAQVGKPFSSVGMFRSMVYPRTTDGSSWYVLPFRLHTNCILSGQTHLAGTAPSWSRPASRRAA